MSCGALVLAGRTCFVEVGARLSGVGGRNPPRMGCVSIGMCRWSGRGEVRGVCVQGAVGRCVCHECGHGCGQLDILVACGV